MKWIKLDSLHGSACFSPVEVFVEKVTLTSDPIDYKVYAKSAAGTKYALCDKYMEIADATKLCNEITEFLTNSPDKVLYL